MPAYPPRSPFPPPVALPVPPPVAPDKSPALTQVRLHPVHRLLLVSPLPPDEKLLWVTLAALSPKGEPFSQSHRQLALDSSLSISKLKGALLALWQRGLLDIEAIQLQDRQYLPNRYQPLWEAWLRQPDASLYTPERLDHFHALTEAYERGLETSYAMLLRRQREEQAKAKG